MFSFHNSRMQRLLNLNPKLAWQPDPKVTIHLNFTVDNNFQLIMNLFIFESQIYDNLLSKGFNMAWEVDWHGEFNEKTLEK